MNENDKVFIILIAVGAVIFVMMVWQMTREEEPKESYCTYGCRMQKIERNIRELKG